MYFMKFHHIIIPVCTISLQCSVHSRSAYSASGIGLLIQATLHLGLEQYTCRDTVVSPSKSIHVIWMQKLSQTFYGLSQVKACLLPGTKGSFEFAIYDLFFLIYS